MLNVNLKQKLNYLGLCLAVTALSACNSDDKKPEVNKAPIAENATVTTQTEVAITDMLMATDPNGDSITFSLDSEPALGSVVITESGSYTYTPNTGVTGADSFRFIVQDPSSETATATVSITIETLDVDFIQFTNDAFNQSTDAEPLTVNGRAYFNAGEEVNFDDLLVQ